METYGHCIIFIMIVTMLWHPVLHGYNKRSYYMALITGWHRLQILFHPPLTEQDTNLHSTLLNKCALRLQLSTHVWKRSGFSLIPLLPALTPYKIRSPPLSNLNGGQILNGTWTCFQTSCKGSYHHLLLSLNSPLFSLNSPMNGHSGLEDGYTGLLQSNNLQDRQSITIPLLMVVAVWFMNVGIVRHCIGLMKGLCRILRLLSTLCSVYAAVTVTVYWIHLMNHPPFYTVC